MPTTKKAPKPSIRELAATHYAAGVLDPGDVPVGRHNLSGLRIIIVCPSGAAVEREPGSNGDGRDEYTATSKGLSLPAVLLFLSKAGVIKGPQSLALWIECIQEANENGGKAEDYMPPEAMEALHFVRSKLQAECKAFRKTPAKRIGVELAQVLIEKP